MARASARDRKEAASGRGSARDLREIAAGRRAQAASKSRMLKRMPAAFAGKRKR